MPQLTLPMFTFPPLRGSHCSVVIGALVRARRHGISFEILTITAYPNWLAVSRFWRPRRERALPL
jgi:hypothetical protein